MPIAISCTVKNASALQTRMSQAVARSSAPPTQPPWIAQITGKRASSSALKQSISWRSDSWNASRARGVAVASSASPLPKTSSAMPAQKCRPVDEITSARVSPPAMPSPRTASRSAGKNGGDIVLSRSGRLSWRWATRSCVSRLKKSFTAAPEVAVGSSLDCASRRHFATGIRGDAQACNSETCRR